MSTEALKWIRVVEALAVFTTGILSIIDNGIGNIVFYWTYWGMFMEFMYFGMVTWAHFFTVNDEF
jgi:hypothetical protein